MNGIPQLHYNVIENDSGALEMAQTKNSSPNLICEHQVPPFERGHKE